MKPRLGAVLAAVEDLRARPPTQHVIEREGPPPPWLIARTAPPAVAPSSNAQGDASVAPSKEEVRLQKREVYERLEREFADEPVDPAWSRDTQRSLSEAIRALRPGLPANPGKPRLPLFGDQGGVFVPYKEMEDDGRFHAVVFVDRPHAAQ
jgi:hypothetical protein